MAQKHRDKENSGLNQPVRARELAELGQQLLLI